MRKLLLLIFSAVFCANLYAQTADIKGSKDYPLFTRMPYFVISGYNESEFVSEGKKQGVQYKINYALPDNGGRSPAENLIVKKHKDIVLRNGGKILTDDGNLATMEVKWNGKNLFVQVGAYGVTYEVVVVEKQNAVVVTDKNAIAKLNSENIEQSVSKQLKGKEDALFAPFPNFYAVSFQESEFIFHGNKLGEKYAIKYLQRNKSQAFPTNDQIIKQYTDYVLSKGGRLLTQTERATVLDFDQNGKNIWLQVKVIGSFYELNAVEKSSTGINAEQEQMIAAEVGQQMQPTVITQPKTEQKAFIPPMVANNNRQIAKQDKTFVQPVQKTIVNNNPNTKKTALANNTAINNNANNQTNNQTNNNVAIINNSADSRALNADFVSNTGADKAGNLPFFALDTSGLFKINSYQESDFISDGKHQGYQYKINYVMRNPTSGRVPDERSILQPYLNRVKQVGGKVTTDDGNLATMETDKYFVQFGSYGASYEIVMVDKSKATGQKMDIANTQRGQDYDSQITNVSGYARANMKPTANPKNFTFEPTTNLANIQAVMAQNNTQNNNAQNNANVVNNTQNNVFVPNYNVSTNVNPNIVANNPNNRNNQTNNNATIVNNSADSRNLNADFVSNTGADKAGNLPFFALDTSGLFKINSYQESDFISDGKHQGYQYKINYVMRNPTSGRVPDERSILQPYLNRVKQVGGKVTTDDGNLATMETDKYFVQFGSYGASYEIVMVDKSKATGQKMDIANTQRGQDYDSQITNVSGYARANMKPTTNPKNFTFEPTTNLANIQAVMTQNNTNNNPNNFTNNNQNNANITAVNNQNSVASNRIIQYNNPNLNSTSNNTASIPANYSNVATAPQQYNNTASQASTQQLTNAAADMNATAAEARSVLQEVRNELKILVAERQQLSSDKEKLLVERERIAFEREKLLADREKLMADKEKGVFSGSANVETTTATKFDGVASELLMQGRLVFQNIEFEFGSANLDDSKSAQGIENIAKLLQANANLKVYIVSHTEKGTSPAQDENLARLRSEKIISQLVTLYRISADRLKARGAGSVSPLASPHTAEGRKLNDRIEVIEQ